MDRSGNKGLLVYLNDQLPADLPVDDDEWQSLVIYRASLGSRRNDDSSVIEKRRDKAQGRSCDSLLTFIDSFTEGNISTSGRRRKQQPLEESTNQDDNDQQQTTSGPTNARRSNRKRKLPTEQPDQPSVQDVATEEDSGSQELSPDKELSEE